MREEKTRLTESTYLETAHLLNQQLKIWEHWGRVNSASWRNWGTTDRTCKLFSPPMKQGIRPSVERCFPHTQRQGTPLPQKAGHAKESAPMHPTMLPSSLPRDPTTWSHSSAHNSPLFIELSTTALRNRLVPCWSLLKVSEMSRTIS